MHDIWKRLGRIFNNPKPPRTVWEKQFDYFDEELQKLCNTQWAQIDFSDLWFYYHDLCHVELQPEVFAYLFPVCLAAWHDSLLKNHACGAGDTEFHNSLLGGKILSGKLLTDDQRLGVYEFFRDSFLTRLDQEHGLQYREQKKTAYQRLGYIWISRLNSLAMVMPRIDLLWDAWWKMETQGRAIAAIQYLSGLLYPFGSNPFSLPWASIDGLGGAMLFDDDSNITNSGWLPENVSYLRSVLTPEWIEGSLSKALSVLNTHPEYPLIERFASDFRSLSEVVHSRIKELPTLLGNHSESGGWSI